MGFDTRMMAGSRACSTSSPDHSAQHHQLDKPALCRGPGRAQVVDGPAVQTPEQLGGYYLVECNGLDEAVELAARIPGATYGTIEVRPVLELPS
jgi:hypothetical protein